jgi:hypothetical protein
MAPTLTKGWTSVTKSVAALVTALTEESDRHPRKCNAHGQHTKRPCGRWAMKGQTVCSTHGGKSPQAMKNAKRLMEIADMRLRGLTVRAVDKLEELLDAESEPVMLGAAKDVLDRGGLKAPDRVEVAASITVKRPW